MKNKDATIIPVIKVGAGLDVHKDKIVICVIQVKGETFFEEFGTSTAELYKIVKYLQDLSVERCVMESTGVYWLSIYSLIEEQGIETVLVNPAYIKQLPGRKTDINDSQWLCRLLINGMVKGSFIPGKEQRQLRDLCRNRLYYQQDLTRIKNRIIKLLEIHNIKIRSVVSNINTQTAKGIIKALSEGETDVDKLLMLCKGKTKKKAKEMKEALNGVLSVHDIKLLKLLIKDWEHYDSQLDELESDINKIITADYKDQVNRINKVSGIGIKTSQVIISEAGKDMDRFHNEDHFASWCGLAPGNDQSADKIRNAKTRKGNKYIRIAMIQSAWAAVRTKNSYWSALFVNLKRRMPGKKAIVAIARKLLRILYRILNGSIEYINYTADNYWERVYNRRLNYTTAKN